MLDHIKNAEELERRIVGAISEAFRAHPEGPHPFSISKRVYGELLNNSKPRVAKQAKRRADAPERLRREVSGALRSVLKIADNPDRAENILGTVERRILAILRKYTIIE